jgi:hypothetical protein
VVTVEGKKPSEQTGYQYEVSFEGDRGVQVRGFTPVLYGTKYENGETVALERVVKRTPAPGTPRSARPTYDVTLWDVTKATQLQKWMGLLLVGFGCLVMLAMMVFANLSMYALPDFFSLTGF